MSDRRKTVGIIPARWDSSRFPGKPLAMISGIPMIQRTYNQALKSLLLDEVVVATDDSRIYDCVTGFGGKCVMTDKSHQTGTERVAQVAESCPDIDFVVNIQGDEPCLNPKIIDELISLIKNNADADVVTPVFLTSNSEMTQSIKRAKCVFNTQNKALYFSRCPLASLRRDDQLYYYVHCGIYCFRRSFLLKISKQKRSELSLAEDLEQLSFLEYGSVYVSVTEDESPAVDYPEDINAVEKVLSCLSNVFS